MDSDASTGTRARWPANHRAALIVMIHVDAPNMERPPRREVLGLDYSATGLQRLLKLLADLDLPATTAWSASALTSYPQLARLAQDAGHELAVSEAAGGSIDHHEALFSKISDIPPIGLVESLPMPTSSSQNAAPLRIGEATGRSWVVSGAGGDLPVLAASGDESSGVVGIPVSPYWIDSAWLAPDRPLPPSSLLEAWSLDLAAVRSEGSLMVVVLHPHISGRPGFSSQIERFLDEAIESGDVWIATAAQVANWWRREGADAPDR